MARKSRRRVIEEMVRAAFPRIQKAFLQSILNIKENAIVGQIVDRLKAGDIDGAVRAVQIDEAAFAPYREAIEQEFKTAGQTFTEALPKRSSVSGQQMIVRFDARNVRAEQILAEIAGQQITRITADQLAMTRTVLREGMIAGRNPTSTALDLVGRVSKATGRRTGGFIGLTEQSAKFVMNARADLESGNYSRYLDRSRRNKSLDRLISTAQKEGRPLTAAEIDQMTGRYADKLLQLRGETIARTETMASIQTAQDEAMHQAVDKELVDRQDVRRVWRTAMDGRVRDTHAEMEGQEVGLDEPFLSPSGAQIMYPGDPDAPADETINCRCVVETRIDFLGALAREEQGGEEQGGEEPPAPEPSMLDRLVPIEDNGDLKYHYTNVGKMETDFYNRSDLSDAEKEAAGAYQARAYPRMNNYSRLGPDSLDPDVLADTERLVRDMDSAIDKSRVQEDVVIYRGLNILANDLKRYDLLTPGEEVVESAFTSFSGTSDQAGDFANNARGVIMRTVLPKGSKALYMDASENELVLPRGTRYRVVRVAKNVRVGDGTKRLNVMDVELLQ